MRRTIRLCVAGALTASLVAALPAGADSHLETVMTGIDNPRGLGFDNAGNLYVASAGSGGNGPCIPSPEGDGESCYGETGAIFKLAAGDVDGNPDAAPNPDNAFVPSLPSLAHEGESAIGPADVSFAGGNLYFTIGLGADPAVRDGALAGAAKIEMMASLHRVVAADGSGLTKVADLGDHEAAHDPDQAGPDTNPFGVVASGGTATVLDSGGNTVIEVDIPGPDPSLTTGAVLPPTFVPAPPFLGLPSSTNIPAQAVPTGIAAHGDDFVIGQLTGFPFAVGAAAVWEYDDGTAAPMAHGFTNVMDVAVGPDGAVYVLEIASNGLMAAEENPWGSLIRLTEATDGTITRELLVDDLFLPGGLAIDAAGQWAYVTTGAPLPADAAPPAGNVVRFDLSADPLVTARDDVGVTDEDMRLVAGDVAGDQFTSVTDDVTDNDGDEVVRIEALDVARGAVWEGSLKYQPARHFSGVDVAPYRACNADDECVNAVLHVTVRETATDRIAGADRMVTAVTASQGAYPDGASSVVIARADLYPDALAGGPLAKASDAPILLTQSDVLTPVVEEELRRLNPSVAYILGGEAAIDASVEAAIDGIVGDVERIGGVDRFETATLIMDALTEADTGQPHVYVVEGIDPDPSRGWPDAVAVSALASWQGSPILLVATEVVPDVTAAALDGVDATIIGGPVAINEATRARIAELADDVDEIAGDDRYHTSQLIAEAGIGEQLRGAQLTLVSGGNWPDALVAGPLAAGNPQHPMMLVHPTDLAGSPNTVAFIQDQGPFEDVDLFGGPAAISNEVEAGIAAANQ